MCAHSNVFSSPKPECHYDVLGLLATASSEEIKIAWRVAARRLHPDINPEELLDLLATLQLLDEAGIEADPSMFDTAGSASSSRSTTINNASSRGPSGINGGTSSSRGSSRHKKGQSSRDMRWLEEMSLDDLYDVMRDSTNPQQARAARAWVSSYAAQDPVAAAHWADRFALDYLTADWDVEEANGPEPSLYSSKVPHPSSSSNPLRGSSWTPFDQHPDRSKHRSKPASAGDYVRSSTDSSTDDEEEDEGPYSNEDWVVVDDLVAIWDVDDSDDDL
eukprot:gene5811-6052_t